MTVIYGADVTSPAYTLSSLTYGYHSITCVQGQNIQAYASQAFNNVSIGAISCANLAANACCINTSSSYPFYISQSFGTGNEKLIRKIRYQYFRLYSGVGTPSFTWNIYRQKLVGGEYVYVLVGTYNVVTNDTGWNEILLPRTEASSCWRISFTIPYYGGVIQIGEVRTAIGEIEMMEGTELGGFVPYLL